ncbi:MAG TPA: alpha/beta hydrolase [Steroidobacteraceae bacterium]|nr:alpha/beta hydrolase [Steroidobacteraceae bacterium]
MTRGTGGWRRGRLGALGALWCVLALAPAAQAAEPPSATLRIGRLTLQRCQEAQAWCGSLERALDPAGRVPGTLGVYFEFYPHTQSGPASGTLVAMEGGPGSPSTDSRADFLWLFGPLRAQHDVLLMDNRGTGRSGAIDCEPLQSATVLSEENIAACGRELGAAAPLYSSNLVADDLDALLDALALGRIDLYGDSTGTYFAQVFALRHPQRLRSLVLDGAYPLTGPDYPWYPHYASSMRTKFATVCARDARCAALGESSLERISRAVTQLRSRPFSARVSADDGHLVSIEANAAQLATVMFAASPALASLRELDAAVRAYQAQDSLPLLRLMAETAGSVDSRDATHAAERFSAGLAAAIVCQDPPQIFDMRLPVAERLRARDLAIARREQAMPQMYAPFTFGEYRQMPLDYTFIDQCVRWPPPLPGAPVPPLVSGAGPYPPVPVLVLSGELDNMTSVEDGQAAAAHFPQGHQVVLANSVHVNALPRGRSDCAARLARRFMQTLEVGDARCAEQIPPLHLVARFARSTAALEPARARPGSGAGELTLRAVTAALLTCADVLERALWNGAGAGVGLRGGTYLTEAVVEGYRIELKQVRWTEDLSVSGTLHYDSRTRVSTAVLSSLSSGWRSRGQLVLRWVDGGDAAAEIGGVLDGRAVLAQAPAP